jgi:hypothetical protein
MSNLLARLAPPAQGERSTFPALSWDGYQSILSQQFTYGGVAYPFGNPATTFEGMVEAVHAQDNVVSAAVVARAAVMSQVRFAWRNTIRTDGSYRQLFGTAELALLERPDPGNLTRPQMLAVMEAQVAYHGSPYIARHADRLEVLNPSLVDVVMFGTDDADEVIGQRAGRKAGYVFWRGGRDHPELAEPWRLNEVIHYVPEPHPVKWWTGSAWVTSLLQEVAIDKASTRYLRKFFEHSATPNLIMKPHESLTPEQIDQYAEVFAKAYGGVGNAFKTMWLGAGSDAMVVGSKIADLDLKSLQGGSETRVAVRSRVPAPILGIREALQGSALTTGNYGAARRLWADGWFAPAVQSLCAAAEAAFPPPAGAEMWHDPVDVLLLQEDAKDAADIMATNATALQALDSAGYLADAAVAAVRDGNLSALIGAHDGNQSVQRAPEPTADVGATRELGVAEVLQKVYLAVANGVITVDEARLIANAAGADLRIPAPPSLSTGATGGTTNG